MTKSSPSKETTLHDRLLGLVRARAEKQTEFNYGILTADRYVKRFLDELGPQVCYRHMCRTRGDWASFDDVMRKAAGTLSYINADMEVKAKGDDELPSSVRRPKNTLMVFRHVLTTSTKDRDGDILRTKGASPDPKMLLLWQHVHTLPIGKMLSVASHTKDELQLYTCIVDMNDLCHDAAVMVDNDMGRFSHGFRAIDFLEIKEGRNSSGGFDVKEFEILEESLVSVPANPDAETSEVLLSLVEGGKLTSPLMKDYGRAVREKTPLTVPVNLNLEVTINGQEVKSHENEFRNEARKGRAGDGSPEKASADGDEAREEEESTKADEVKFSCECLDCGHAVESKEHCQNIECPKCGGEMRRKERPGPGKAEEKSIPFASLDGSWEKATEELRMDLKQYLVGMGISVLDGDWICIVGTYEDHVIACVEKSGTGRQEYYRIDWTKVDGKPSFCGEPKLVEVEVTTEIIEKMKSLQNQAAYQPEGQKPYPNEHALRLNDPDKYDKIRRQNDKFEDGIHAIFGILEGKTELQSIRFSADKFTSEEALKWLEEHDYKTSGFEPAKKVEKQLVDDATSGGTAAAPPVQDFGGKKKMVCPECGYVGPGVDGKCPECGAKLVPKKKGFNSEKRGRVLNKANEKKIRDAVDDLEEASKMDGVPRGCKALIRQAKRSLGDVVSSLGGDGEVVEEKTEAGVSAKQAMAILLATGGEAERKVMASMLKAIEDGHQADEVVEQYAEIFG